LGRGCREEEEEGMRGFLRRLWAVMRGREWLDGNKKWLRPDPVNELSDEEGQAIADCDQQSQRKEAL
jgi:hypothetical protein